MAWRTINVEEMRLNGLRFRVVQERQSSQDPARVSKASVLDKILKNAGIERLSEQELKQRQKGLEVLNK